MKLIDKINLILLTTTPLGSSEGVERLASILQTALTTIINVLYGVGMLILGKKLITSIIFSKKSDNPDDEIARYKKEISNTIIAMVIITVVDVGLTVIFNTILRPWIESLFGK